MPEKDAAPGPQTPWGDSYWAESRQPLSSLVFITPLLVIYEVGVLVLGPDTVRNGADAWLRYALQGIGFGQYFLLPALTVVLLLAWHHLTHRPWRVSVSVLNGMAGESILLAVCLRAILYVQGSLFNSFATLPAASFGSVVSSAVGFLGAGIYEELLFRLMLLPLLAWCCRRAGMQASTAMLTAVIVSSLLFAAAHYVGPAGESLEWFSFLFRFLAGVFFAVLFVYRGFGIAAGAHAGYDLLVGLL